MCISRVSSRAYLTNSTLYAIITWINKGLYEKTLPLQKWLRTPDNDTRSIITLPCQYPDHQPSRLCGISATSPGVSQCYRQEINLVIVRNWEKVRKGNIMEFGIQYHLDKYGNIISQKIKCKLHIMNFTFYFLTCYITFNFPQCAIPVS